MEGSVAVGYHPDKPEFINIDIIPDSILLESLKSGAKMITTALSEFDKQVLINFTRGCGYILLGVSRNLVKNGTTGLRVKKAKREIEEFSFMTDKHVKYDESDVNYLERLIFYYYIYLYNSIAKSPKSTFPFKVYRGIGHIRRYMTTDPDTVFYIPEFLHTTPSYKIAYSYGIENRDKKTNQFCMLNFYIHPLASYSSVSQFLTQFKGEEEIAVSCYNRIIYISSKTLGLDDYDDILEKEDIKDDLYYSGLLKTDISNGFVIEHNYLILPIDDSLELPNTLDELKYDISQIYSRGINQVEKQMVELISSGIFTQQKYKFGKKRDSIDLDIHYLKKLKLS